MDAETKKLIQEQYAKLPKQLQDAIQSSHVDEMIGAIAAQNKLHIDQIDVFKNEVMLLMMGFTDPIEFVGELQKSLGVAADVALKIATDTNEQILLPIRDKVENATSNSTPVTPIATSAPAVTASPVPEKSVVMPSAAKVTAPSAPAPSTPATPPTPAPTISLGSAMPVVEKPTGLPVMQHVDDMLNRPTVSIAPTAAGTTPAPTTPAAPVAPSPTEIKKSDAPAPPPIYKTDPYHEPID
jgi:hypothetical protein